MCGRFTLTSSEEQIAAMLPGLIVEPELTPRYNIAPTQNVAAVLNAEATRLTFVWWGLIPSWAKDPAIGNRMINARAETVHEKPSYKRPLVRQRCLILADGFYEWRKKSNSKTKIPYYISSHSGEPMAFAGLWDRWRGPDGETVVSATIITTTPNALMAPIHDRMPVILPEEAYSTWLDARDRCPSDLLSHLKPCDPERLRTYPVTTRVNSPAMDDASCLEPAD